MVSRLTGGHSGSVLCVDVSPVTLTVASGSDTGELCLWSGAGELLQKYTRPDTECTSVLFSREKADRLYAAFCKEVLILDSGQLQTPVFTLVSNQDEVSQLALDDKEQFLAACDEGGEIKVYGLQDRKVFKTLRFLHTNMCSSVVFRTKQRPWELLSAGLDYRLVHWNFSKPEGINQFNMQELHGMTCDASDYLLNPPFIHHLARNREGTVTAAALENGLVAVFDSSAKHLKETMCLKAHLQGAAQVCFTAGSIMLTAGNDAKIIVWDLSKAEPHLGQANGVVNGNSNANAHNEDDDDDNNSNDDIDQHNNTVTEACRFSVIDHSDKVNWLAPFQRGGEENSAWFVVVADNSSNLTVYPLDIPI